MNSITINNGKAFYEGVEIENFAECQPLEGIHFRNEQYPLRWEYKDGSYPIPEGWEVVKEYWMSSFFKNSNTWEKIEYKKFLECSERGHPTKQTARLVRKEQPIQSKEELRKEFQEWKTPNTTHEQIFEFFFTQLQERDRQIEELKRKL